MKRVCIVGGGTAGMAAAYALKGDKEVHLTVVEREMALGGTAVNAWVNTWIAGLNPPYLQEIFKELKAVGQASGSLESSWLAQKYRKDNGPASTLIFDVRALGDRYMEDLKRAGAVLYTGYEFRRHDVVHKTGNLQEVHSIVIRECGSGKEVTVEADYFIDCSGDGVLCRCVNPVEDEDYYYGEDPKIRFDEPNAPQIPDREHLNRPSLFYKICLPFSSASSCLSPVGKPDYISGDGYNINGYDFAGKPEDFVNPLTGQGLKAIDALKDYSGVYREAQKRCKEHWDYVRSELKSYAVAVKKPEHRQCEGFPPGLHVYEFSECAPMLGVREGYRIHCEYMLKQNDLTEKIDSRNLKHFIACGGHTIDFHGVRGSDFSEFNKRIAVSGIPYECIVPRKLANVLIACRAYGASHIALSARRINKDMAQLGWAAGHAVRICIEENLRNTRDVNVGKLQSEGYTAFKAGVEYIEQLMK